jgi:hypothetical protein
MCRPKTQHFLAEHLYLRHLMYEYFGVVTCFEAEALESKNVASAGM